MRLNIKQPVAVWAEGADMTRLSFFLGFTALLAMTAAKAAELPESIKQAGALRLTVNSTYAPMEYRDPTTNQLVGLDIDLANELAKRLGVKIVWSETPFAELIPSLQTKRADFIISGISDRSSRREAADFIDYLATGPQFFVLTENEAKSPIDLCGRKVGTTRSTSFPVEIEKWSKQNCEANGKPALQYVPGENSIDVRNQLKQGRIDAAVQGTETLPYAQQQEAGKYRVIGEPFATGYQGIMFRKDDVALREVVTEHLAAMIADGSYKAILDKYGLGANAVARPMMNASTQ
jgi:polar amino acid transport system substrate-binding protein